MIDARGQALDHRLDVSNRGAGDARPLPGPGDTADGRLPDGLRPRLRWLRSSRLVRQNLVLFAGGLVAGIGGFVYHAIAGRVLGPSLYGEVASIIALYAVFTTPTLILVLVLARYSATLTASGTTDSVRYLVAPLDPADAIPSLLSSSPASSWRSRPPTSCTSTPPSR